MAFLGKAFPKINIIWRGPCVFSNQSPFQYMQAARTTCMYAPHTIRDADLWTYPVIKEGLPSVKLGGIQCDVNFGLVWPRNTFPVFNQSILNEARFTGHSCTSGPLCIIAFGLEVEGGVWKYSWAQVPISVTKSHCLRAWRPQTSTKSLPAPFLSTKTSNKMEFDVEESCLVTISQSFYTIYILQNVSVKNVFLWFILNYLLFDLF